MQGHASVSGRGVVILPGLGNASGDYTKLKSLLTQRGLHVKRKISLSPHIWSEIST